MSFVSKRDYTCYKRYCKTLSLEEDPGLGSGPDAGDADLGLKQRVEAFERGLVVAELRRCGGNKSEAARRLGIGRVTLLDKIKKYGID